jgi:uncharacterized glyoxalase superfamily protein PhnB
MTGTRKEMNMKPTGSYPVLLVEDVAPVAAFYERHFDYAHEFASGWYVHMRARSLASSELAVLRYDHETIPPAGRHPTTGLIINIEVEDAAAEFARLQAAGLPMLQPLRDELFGQRHFITADPNGVLIDVITPIEADPDWLAEHGF